jgi:NodT family efflux transporter outer membrane factor (OMF) lipoprotein
MIVLVFVLGLTGCVDTAQVKLGHGIEMPKNWASALVSGSETERALAPLDDWLPDFQTPALEDLVAEALGNNRNLQVAAARVKEARAIARMQTGAMMPSVTAGLAGVRARNNFPDGSGGNNKLLGTNYDAELELSWEIDLWGKLNSERRASVLDYEAQAANFQYAQLSLAGGVVQNWFALVEAENQLALARESEISFTRAAAMVRSRYEQGLRRGLDVRLAASNAASARALSAARAEQVRRASTALEVLLGRYPSGALVGDSELPVLALHVTDALPTELLTRRPDLSAVQAQAVAAELRHSASRKAMLPTLRINSAGSYEDGNLKDLDNPANLVWFLAGGIVQPLFQGGALKARAEAAEARGDQALAQYAQSLLTALQEVETTLFAEDTLAIREASMNEAAFEAVEAEKLASDLYSRGLTGIFELLEAQRRSLNAQSSWLEVRRQRLSNRVTLYLALGGGIPDVQKSVPVQHAAMDPGTPVPPVD